MKQDNDNNKESGIDINEIRSQLEDEYAKLKLASVDFENKLAHIPDLPGLSLLKMDVKTTQKEREYVIELEAPADEYIKEMTKRFLRITQIQGTIQCFWYYFKKSEVKMIFSPENWDVVTIEMKDSDGDIFSESINIFAVNMNEFESNLHKVYMGHSSSLLPYEEEQAEELFFKNFSKSKERYV